MLTDGLGRKVDFRNTVIIMTSNIGVRDLNMFGAGIGFSTKNKENYTDENTRSTIQNALQKTFNPEFINRLDDIIVFNNLSTEHIRKIIDILLEKIIHRMKGLGYTIDITTKARKFLTEHGYEPKYGARPLARAIQKYVEYPVAEEILKGKIQQNDTLIIDHSESKAQALSITHKSQTRKSNPRKNEENPK